MPVTPPNIVTFYGVSENSAGEMLLIMEYCENQTLKFRLQNDSLDMFGSALRLEVALGMSCGLAYLHQRGFVHRDIKSSNVLLANGYVAKLSDFGLTRREDVTRTHNSTGVEGTTVYLAPELLVNFSDRYIPESDIYALGVVFWEMLSELYRIPHAGLEGQLVMLGVLNQQLRPDLPDNIVDGLTPLSEIAQHCWQQDPTHRPSAAEIIGYFRGKANSINDGGASTSAITGTQFAVNSPA